MQGRKWKIDEGGGPTEGSNVAYDCEQMERWKPGRWNERHSCACRWEDGALVVEKGRSYSAMAIVLLAFAARKTKQWWRHGGVTPMASLGSFGYFMVIGAL